MKFTISEELYLMVMNYLGKCPYFEVFKLLEQMQNVKPDEEPQLAEIIHDDGKVLEDRGNISNEDK